MMLTDEFFDKSRVTKNFQNNGQVIHSVTKFLCSPASSEKCAECKGCLVSSQFSFKIQNGQTYVGIKYLYLFGYSKAVFCLQSSTL